jgi:rSAM/selenodomain-associated transferase 2
LDFKFGLWNPHFNLQSIDSRKTHLLWARIACITITLAALFLLFRRLKLHALVDAFRTMRPGWFIAAVLANGIAFLPAAWRWHLVLRLTGNSVHPGATARLTLVGHFLYTVLFGAFGGDTAKVALYARWYRFPFPTVLATAPLDRLLGFGGLLVFAAIALGAAAVSGAFPHADTLSGRRPQQWIAAFLIAAAVIVLMFKRSRLENAVGQFRRVLLTGARQLLVSPAVAISGVLCGFAVQLGLNAVLAFNLQAVTQLSIPWSAVAWTFPLIAIISALPITVAGLGTREGAALLLLGLYGVPEATAVAASLLTLSASVIWAIVGGLLLWRESWRQRQQRTTARSISIVIPALNEAESLPETLRRALALPETLEVIVVDGGSTDTTLEIAARFGTRALQAPANRGAQLRLGAQESRADIILLLHADTWLPAGAGRALTDCLRDVAVVGGGYWKVFQNPTLLLLGSRFKCAVRLWLGQRIAADQGIFMRKEVLEAIGGVPDMPLMEEFELCRRLRKVGRLALADAVVETSARRFLRLGVLRTYLRMWSVMLRYYLGTPPDQLRRLYEKD